MTLFTDKILLYHLIIKLVCKNRKIHYYYPSNYITPSRMKKGNMFLLAAGYLAGLAVALRFNKKSPTALQEEMDASSEKCKTFAHNVVDIHKNLFETVETTLFSEENKKRLEAYKQKFLTELDGFEKEAMTHVEEWKKNGMEKRDEAEATLRDLYTRRVEIMEQARHKGVELLEDAKTEGNVLIEEGQKIANKVFDEARKSLDKAYADIRSKIEKK